MKECIILSVEIVEKGVVSELLTYKFPESDDEEFYEENPGGIDESYIYNSMKWSECMGCVLFFQGIWY